MFFRISLALAAALVAAGPLAQAQEFQRPFKVVVTTAPGATNDTLARLYAAKMSELFGQPVVVENRAGGNSIPGADFVAKAPPDGYTLLFGNTTLLAIMGGLFKNLPYDPKEFVPVTVIALAPSVLVVHPSVPARNLKEFIAYAKANPAKLNYASPGSGSPFHLSTELFKSQTGTELVHVPFKGNGPAMIELLAGRVQLLFANPPDVLAHIRSGALRPIVGTGATRIALLPDLPTVAEEGLKSVEAVSFFAYAAPRGTPRDVVAKLYAGITKVGAQAEIQKRLVDLGAEPVSMTPDASASFIAIQADKWNKVIRDSGAKPDD